MVGVVPAPFDVPYMERALLAGLLLALPLGVLGTWCVLRSLAFFAHAVGVATFPGVVVGLGVPTLGPFAGALLAALAFTGAVGVAETDERVRGGAVTGLALSAALALGAVLVVSVFAVSTPVESVLFGSLLAISDADVVRCAVVAALGTGGALLATGRLAAATFDREWAGPAGARPRSGDALLLGLLALCVVTALPAVGSLLVSGLLVVPAATARMLTERLGVMLACSVALCALETVAGLAVARWLDLSPGASIAALAGLVFGAVAAAGLVARRRAGAAAIPAPPPTAGAGAGFIPPPTTGAAPTP